MRVVHVINCLSMGGSERQLLRLAAEERLQGGQPTIVTLLARNTLRAEAEAAGVRVESVGVRSALGVPFAVGRLGRLLRGLAPDVVQSWLYYANAACAAALPAAPGGPALAWNVRQTIPDPRREPWRIRAAIRAGLRRQPRVAALVANAESVMRDHRALGFRAPFEEVIPNAIDPPPWSAAERPALRAQARAALGLPADAEVVAHAARLHPMKDHAGMLLAFESILQERPASVVLMIGRGVDAPEPLGRLVAGRPALAAAEAAGRLRRLGERPDLQRLRPAMDVLVSSSAWGEGFPNVVAEAVAAGVPVVTTDVGDSAAIVGDRARVVPPGRPDLLAAAVIQLLGEPAERRESGADALAASLAARTSAASVLRRYQSLWSRIHAARNGDPPPPSGTPARTIP